MKLTAWRIEQWRQNPGQSAIEALELVLMFYSPGMWRPEQRERWHRITGKDETTTKVMCDHIRGVLEVLKS